MSNIVRLCHLYLLHTKCTFPIINIVVFLKHGSFCCLDSQSHGIFPSHILSFSFIKLRFKKKKKCIPDLSHWPSTHLCLFSILGVFTSFLHLPFLPSFSSHPSSDNLLFCGVLIGFVLFSFSFFFFSFWFPDSAQSHSLCPLSLFISSCSSKISTFHSPTFGYFFLVSFSSTPTQAPLFTPSLLAPNLSLLLLPFTHLMVSLTSSMHSQQAHSW